MFVSKNYYRRHTGNQEIVDHKEFYKYFSGNVEWGGSFSHIDHLVKDRFHEIFGEMYSICLRKMPENILDLGCGNGSNLPLSLIFRDTRYHGVDYSAKTTAIAKKGFPNTTFSTMDAFNLGIKDKSYDMVILAFVLSIYRKEEDRIAILKESQRVMKDNGILVLTVLSDNFLLKNCVRLSRVLGRIKGVSLPKDFEAVHFKVEDIMLMADKSGLRCLDKIKVSRLLGILKCVKHLNLSAYKREFGKAERDFGKQMINKYSDLKKASGSKVLVQIFYLLGKIFPNLFSVNTIYVFAKKN